MTPQLTQAVPFVEKYRPVKLTDFVGNKDAVIKLENWLRTWKSQTKKVALLIGPAGVGKTSVALYLANKYSYEFVEVNASDKRNKKAVEFFVGKSSTEGTVLQGAKVRKLILVDEADGLFGHQDRGGGNALKKAITSTRTPILATANDPDAKSLKSAKRHMFKVEFKPLKEQEILYLLKKVVQKEGLDIDQKTLINIVKNSCGDARSALNDLESIAHYGDYSNVVFSSRNQSQTLENALTKMFKAKSLIAARDATSGADVDYKELLMYMYENAYKQASSLDELFRMYQLIANADFYLSQCYITQNWSFLKYFFTFISSVGIVKQSSIKSQKKFRFPSYWAKIGRLRFKHAKLNSIVEKSKSKLHCSSNEFKEVFYPYFRIIFRSSPKMAAGISVWLRLEEDEINFLTDKSKKLTKIILEHAEKAYLQMAEEWLETPSTESTTSLFDFTYNKNNDQNKTENSINDTNKNNSQKAKKKNENVSESIKEEKTEEEKLNKNDKKKSQVSLDDFF